MSSTVGTATGMLLPGWQGHRGRSLCSCPRWCPSSVLRRVCTVGLTPVVCMSVCVWGEGKGVLWGVARAPAHGTVWKLRVKVSKSPHASFAQKDYGALAFFLREDPTMARLLWARGQAPLAFCSPGTCFPPRPFSRLLQSPLCTILHAGSLKGSLEQAPSCPCLSASEQSHGGGGEEERGEGSWDSCWALRTPGPLILIPETGWRI